MAEIIPSILVASKDEFERRLHLVEHDCSTVHVDVLDGSLFPATSWFDAASVGAMRTGVKYELHVMTENPLSVIEAWKAHVPGLHRAITHAEIQQPVKAITTHIRQLLHLEAGIAVNPETPLEDVRDLLPHIDLLTVMGVHPGASGQAFLGASVLEKIREARRLHPNLPIEIDGGVRPELLGPLLKAGCTHVCAASMLFSTKDPTEALRTAQKAVSTPPSTA